MKNEMGFKGFVVSDSMAIQYTSPNTYEEQIINADFNDDQHININDATAIQIRLATGD